jgi:hypothetical protein
MAEEGFFDLIVMAQTIDQFTRCGNSFYGIDFDIVILEQRCSLWH